MSTGKQGAKDLLAQLRSEGFRPSKSLGQNFLLDPNLARALAREARVAAGDFVLEIGPGLGALTEALLALGARVLAVEIDQRLAARLAENFEHVSALELLTCDALAGKHALAPQLLERLPARGPWKLASNLPYAAGTPILALLARLSNPPTTMTALVQTELARRICASPGSKDYGALSVRMQLEFELRIVRRVASDVFWPRPRVESAVLGAALRPESARGLGLGSSLDVLLGHCFGQRRKALLGLVADLVGGREPASQVLAQAQIDPGSRPQDLSGAAFVRLAQACSGCVQFPLQTS